MTTKIGDSVTIYHEQMADYGIRPDEIFNVVHIKYPLMLLCSVDHTFYVDTRTIMVSALPVEDESEAQS